MKQGRQIFLAIGFQGARGDEEQGEIQRQGPDRGCERVLNLTIRTQFSGAERKGGEFDGVIMGCSCVPLGERHRAKRLKMGGGGGKSGYWAG